jgi:hypothetical protein
MNEQLEDGDKSATAEMPFVHGNHADNRMSARSGPG